mmetsp:Transcript_13670/g.29641  ORF Transcript_13670/g.29641 Transcript_13670/m.29641 type:complete len:207 (-) Transcript_13670:801-1421(-)
MHPRSALPFLRCVILTWTTRRRIKCGKKTATTTSTPHSCFLFWKVANGRRPSPYWMEKDSRIRTRRGTSASSSAEAKARMRTASKPSSPRNEKMNLRSKRERGSSGGSVTAFCAGGCCPSTRRWRSTPRSTWCCACTTSTPGRCVVATIRECCRFITSSSTATGIRCWNCCLMCSPRRLRCWMIGDGCRWRARPRMEATMSEGVTF